MFKRREKPNASRKRDEAGDGDGESGVVPETVAETRKTNSGSGSNEGGSINASTRKGDAAAAELAETKKQDTAISGWKANDHASQRPSDDAVRQLETEPDFATDTRATILRNQKIHEGLKSGELEKGVYRGIGAYKQYAERSENAISQSKYSGLLGPNRAMQNVRSTMRFEFWNASSGSDGGICKDYKETGYCGWGDSCKYLHDRSDYKSGHVIEKEWEEKQKAIEEKKRKKWEKKMMKRAAGEDEASTSEEEGSDGGEELPLCCQACKDRWEECTSIPVITVCGHYFCEDCAMTNYARTPLCLTCGAPTNGIFNSADAIEDKLKQKREALAEKKNMKKKQKLNLPYGINTDPDL